MTIIDKRKPVLVTGATGYVAGWIIKKLLEEGITVHAAVRNPDKTEKLAHLNALADQLPGHIKYFKSDLLQAGSYALAMAGCELVYHTASPFIMNYEDPQSELIDPALNGTANVLQTATATPSVKRVVVTSSCAAIYTDAVDTLNAPGGKITEEVWNTTASLDYQPYSYSKTLAERKAWEIAGGQSQWDLVTINPALVLGPPLNPSSVTSASFDIMRQLTDGTLKMGAPKLGMGLVDVRDVAEAHYRAGFRPEANGRYITAAYNTDLLEIAQVLQAKYGDKYPLPNRALPKWLLMLVGPLANKLFTRRYIRDNINVPWLADNSKIKQELDINFRPMKDTMEDTMEAMIAAGEV